MLKRSRVMLVAGSSFAVILGGAIVVPSEALPVAAPAISGYADLHDFGGSYGGTSYPLVMAQGRDGRLYGVTTTGGAHSDGTVFRIGSDGSDYTTLHSFNGTQGRDPVGGLTLGVDGNFYGMAEHGGKHGYGNIFRISPTGAFTVLYSFTGAKDGGYPVSPLTLGSDGNFYGTSYPGFAFTMTSAGHLTVLAKVPTTTSGALLQASNGAFYGVTEFAGRNSAGTVYRLSGRKVTILHNFNSTTGSYPVGGVVQGSDGYLYGTTTAGGGDNAGVIYRIALDGSSYSPVVVYDSGQGSAGYQSFAGLVAGNDGKLYGTTIWGGLNGVGVIFSLTTSGGYTDLNDFATPTGEGAYATPMQDTSGDLYGITARGGGGQKGVVYGYSFGAPPFVALPLSRGSVGQNLGILGQGFSSASGVTFNGAPASFHVISDTYLTATIPAGETGIVDVQTSAGSLFSRSIVKVIPHVTSFSPRRVRAGNHVTIRGNGLIQASQISCGGHQVLSYTVNSDSKLTITVPPKAKTGKITVRTPGGSSTSGHPLTVVR